MQQGIRRYANSANGYQCYLVAGGLCFQGRSTLSVRYIALGLAHHKCTVLYFASRLVTDLLRKVDALLLANVPQQDSARRSRRQDNHERGRLGSALEPRDVVVIHHPSNFVQVPESRFVCAAPQWHQTALTVMSCLFFPRVPTQPFHTVTVAGRWWYVRCRHREHTANTLLDLCDWWECRRSRQQCVAHARGKHSNLLLGPTCPDVLL